MNDNKNGHTKINAKKIFKVIFQPQKNGEISMVQRVKMIRLPNTPRKNYQCFIYGNYQIKIAGVGLIIYILK